MASKLFRAFQGATRKTAASNFRPARMGWVDPATNAIVYQAYGRPDNWVFVRPVQGNDTQPYAVENRGAPWVYDMPVRLQRDPVTGLEYVEGSDPMSIEAFNPGGLTPESVQHHTHAIGSGNEYYSDPRLFLGCLVTITTPPSLSVQITAGFYYYNNKPVYFPGILYDLTSFVPGTANTHCWVFVGIDPTVPGPVAVAGTAVSTSTALTPFDLANITFSGYIPLAGVLLTNGDTSISLEQNFIDARAFVTGIGGGIADVDYYQTMQVNGTAQTQRGILDIIPGSNITITGTDDSGGNRTKVTINAASGLTSPLTTKGDIWGWDTNNNRVPVGADNTFLTGNSSATLGVSYRLIVDGDLPFLLSGHEIASGTIDATNTIHATDNQFFIHNFPDNTKVIEFSAASISHSTTRTYTLPDITDTLVTLTATQTLTNKTLTSPVINTGVSGTAISTDGTFASQSDTILASQKAVYTYVNAVAQGLSPKDSVVVATTTALPANTYNNGSSGVGATLTGNSTGVLTIDGHNMAANERCLVKNEATGANDGIFLCTTPGAIGVAYVLTRATDNDTSAKILGSYTFVESGTTNGSSGWVNTNTSAITIGATAITWTQFSGAGEISVNPPLTKTGNTISLTTPLAANYGGTGQDFSASTGIIHVASGTMSATAVNIASSDISGILPLANGGTNADLSASGSATAFLAQNASHVISARSLVSADIPSLDASKITSGQLVLARGGTGADLSGTGPGALVQTSSGATVTVETLSAARGGTGQTTLTAHDLLVGNGTSAVNFLAPGTAANYARSNGTDWLSAVLAAADLTGQVAVANGGTGLGTLTAHDLLVGNGTSSVNFLAPGATNGVPVQSNGTDFVVSALDYNNTAATTGLQQQKQVISSSLTIAAAYSAVVAEIVEISSGTTITLGAGGVLAII